MPERISVSLTGDSLKRLLAVEEHFRSNTDEWIVERYGTPSRAKTVGTALSVLCHTLGIPDPVEEKE